MVSDGLDNFLRLGARWCFAILALAQVAIADVESDVASINEIVDAMATDVDTISDDVAQIYTTLQTIESHLSTINGSDITAIRSTSQSILSAIQSINSYIREATLSVHDAYLYEQLENFKRESHNDTRRLTSIVSNQLDTIIEKLETVTIGGGEWFPTNLLATLVLPEPYRFGTPADINSFFSTIFGRQPTVSESNAFRFMSQWFSLPLYDLIDIAYELDTDVLYFDQPELLDTITDALSLYHLNFDSGWPYSLGRAYYYEYGTREATDLLGDLSNLVASVSETVNNDNLDLRMNNFIIAITNALVTIINEGDYNVEQVTTEDGTRTVINEQTKEVIGDVAEDVSASFSVGDDIAEINTNEIENIRDGSYATQLSRITSQSALEEVTADIRAEIDSMGNEMSSYLVPSADATSYEINFGTFGLFGVESEEITFTLNRPSTMYFSIQHFCIGVLKIIVVYLCITSIFHRIAGG